MKYVQFALPVAMVLGVFLSAAQLDAARSSETQTIVLPGLAQFDLPKGFEPLVPSGPGFSGPSYLASYRPHQSDVTLEVLQIDVFRHITLRERNSTAFQQQERASGGERLIKESDTDFAGSDCSAYLYNDSSTQSSTNFGRVEYRLLVNHLKDVVAIHIWVTSTTSDIAPAQEAAKELADQMSRNWRWILNPGI